MTQPLRVLVIEDSIDDAILLCRELERSFGAIHSRRVDTSDELQRALAEETWDIVLSDHGMPRFSATEALAILQASSLDIPFIIVSGAIGEEVAVSAMKAGASDFLLKDNLSRLAPAITRELREAHSRAERSAATASLRALEIENAQVLETSRIKAQFLASVSHELRTPLNAIIGFADLFVAGTIGALEAQQLEAIQLIQKSGYQLLHLIDDVLDLARIDAGKMSVSCAPCDLARVCQEAVRTLQPIARAKQLELVFVCDQPVPLALVDANRMRQVVYNLVSNAMKFTRRGGTVTTRCYVVEASHVRVEVIDTGVGIAAEDLGKLFVPFARLTNAQSIPGTGLGLALVKQLILLMGGDLGVESKVGSGSTFYADLPVASSDAQS